MSVAGNLTTFRRPPDVDEVYMDCQEVSTLCGKSGQPDFYRVEVWYGPRDVTLCSKALKEWYRDQRTEGYSCETLAQTVLDLVEEETDPLWARVLVTQRSRGGISIRTSARSTAPARMALVGPTGGGW